MDEQSPHYEIQEGTTRMSKMSNIGGFFKSKLFTVLLLLFVLGLSFGAGMQYGQKRAVGIAQAQGPAGFGVNGIPPGVPESDFKLFWQVWSLVSAQYFDKSAVDAQKMYYGAIQGMVSALGDPYTSFLPPEENKEVKDQLGGNFTGVGMELGSKDNALVVIAPLEDTPAQKAGIMAGDYVIKIDGNDASSLAVPEAVKKIRGPKGEKVTLEMYRQGDDKPRTIEIIRDTIHVKSVTYQNKGNGIAYLKIAQFGDQTNTEWDAGVAQALKDNAKTVIVDVRNNGGGYMGAAIYIASEFTNGTIMKQERADGTKKTETAVRQGKMLTLPVTVLINQGSASASEILTGALIDNKRAKTVGANSFGKGTIQEVQDLEKGAGIHITRARWLTPNETWVHKKGIKPDVEVELKADDVKSQKDPQLDKAIEMAQQALR